MANNQVGLTPSTNPSLGLHIHVPSGVSANTFTHPTDFPSVSANATPPSGGKSLKASIQGQGTDRVQVRFANPS